MELRVPCVRNFYWTLTSPATKLWFGLVFRVAHSELGQKPFRERLGRESENLLKNIYYIWNNRKNGTKGRDCVYSAACKSNSTLNLHKYFLLFQMFPITNSSRIPCPDNNITIW